MNRSVLAALLLLPGLVFAQQRVLEKAEPPPPPPLPAEGQESAADPEPQVTIRKERDRTVAEYRLNGRLYMLKVTQANGLVYYLIDERGDGQFTRRDSLDSGLRVPMWVIKSW
jgi:hypothetical protein